MELTYEELAQKCAELKQKNIQIGAKLGGYVKKNKELLSDIETLKIELQKVQNELLTTKCRYKEELEKYELYDEKNSASINDLYRQIEHLKNELKQASKDYVDMCGERDFYKANYEYVMDLPWYKRIFAKK